MNTRRLRSTAGSAVVVSLVVGLILSAACGRAWAQKITPPWVDDFAKGKTDGKVPPEVKAKEKEDPTGACSKTNKDGSIETDVVYSDPKTGETTTIEYIKTEDKKGNPKTVWKIKVEKPGQPTRTTTYDPEPGNETKTEKVDDKPPTSKAYDPKKDYSSLDIGYGPGVTIGEPPMLQYPSGEKAGPPPTGGGSGRS